ncbi:MAG: DUF3145 domain-containing protein [Propioniciclava sp.]
MTTTSGVLYIHSASAALRPHIEWALGAALGDSVDLYWSVQPAERGSYRTEHTWHGPVGTASRLASSLKGWDRIRFEVTENPTAGSTGERYSYTPALGIFTGTTGPHGDIVVGENRLQLILRGARDETSLRQGLQVLLGTAWDEELDVFRQAADGVPLRWLHAAG